jgi:hypothetical protein
MAENQNLCLRWRVSLVYEEDLVQLLFLDITHHPVFIKKHCHVLFFKTTFRRLDSVYVQRQGLAPSIGPN